ncbi:anti-sigma factor antagonist [Nonomuraea mangrovi]|uniref:Anti-sigma factor antagonist n=1 Tax=Nonomuraea mangrovi TaxID=2316207 RepID=A0ABW4SMV2_9ACTN
MDSIAPEFAGDHPGERELDRETAQPPAQRTRRVAGNQYALLDEAEHALIELLADVPVDVDAAQGALIAVREAVANAVQHGCAAHPGTVAVVDLAVESSRLVVRVADAGPGFDPRTVLDPLTPQQRLRPSGRGIFLMHHLMDSVEYAFPPGGGCVLTLRKTVIAARRDGEREERKGSGMDIKKRTADGVVIFDLNGKITIGEGAIQVREAVREALSDGQRRIVLNLAQVSSIDSSGLGELVSSYTTVQNHEGKIILLDLPPKIQDLLTITQLITVFDTYDDEKEAVASFS